MKYFTHNVAETEKLGEEIARTISPPRAICLIGDLGAGKTAFTRGFVRGFGIFGGVSSPTFTLMHRYEGSVTINHYDLYRLSDFDELLDIGFEDDVENGISLIEWPDKFMEYMPPDSVIVKISRTDGGDDERTVEVTR